MAAAYNTLYEFNVRNSGQFRTKHISVFCGVRILVISCHNGLVTQVSIPLSETLGEGYVSEFRLFLILECGAHTVCYVIRYTHRMLRNTVHIPYVT